MDSIFNIDSILHFMPSLFSMAIMGVCIYYLIVKPKADSILLGIGSSIHFLTNIYYSISPFFLETWDNAEVKWTYSIAFIIDMMGTMCFTAGIIILIIGKIKLEKAKAIN